MDTTRLEKNLKSSIVRFAVIGAALMFGSWFAGGFLPVHNQPNCTAGTQTVRDIIGGCTADGLGHKIAALIVAGVLTWLMLPFIRQLMGFARMNLLRGQIFTDDYNDSPAWLIGFLFVSMVIVAMGKPFSAPLNYLAFLVFAIGFFILVAIGSALFLIVAVAGAHKTTMVVRDFADPGSNAVAIFISCAMLAAASVV